jgi:hypothetical protein
MAQLMSPRRRGLALGALACVLLPRAAPAAADRSPVQRSAAVLMRRCARVRWTPRGPRCCACPR